LSDRQSFSEQNPSGLNSNKIPIKSLCYLKMRGISGRSLN